MQGWPMRSPSWTRKTKRTAAAVPTGGLEIAPWLTDPKSFHQLLTQIGLDIRAQTAQHFFAAHRIHRDELAQELIARSLLLVTAPGHAGGEEQTYDPDNNRAPRNLGQHRINL